MRGSSVHFKRIASAIHAVSHASRDVAPEYLLPADVSMGTHVVIDDQGQVQKLLEHKLSLASRQAKATKDYSPMWEGVINLPDPADATPQQQIEIVKEWCVAYEKMTGHKVIRADVHLDEGFVDDSGKACFNAHAHVMCDRTDDKGKVKKLTSTVLREVQNMTAEVTTLQRGIDSRKTGRKHIGHQHFRFDAEKNRLDVEKPKADLARLQDLSKKWSDADLEKIKKLQAHIDSEPERLVAALAAQKAQLDEQYRLDRAALKASGDATQRDYQQLKTTHATAVADLAKAQAKLATAQSKADLVPELQAGATKAQAEIDRLTTVAAQVQQLETKLATAQTKADLVPDLQAGATKAQAEIDRLTTVAAQVQQLETKLATAQIEADKVPQLVATVATQATAFQSLKREAMDVITPLRKEVKTMKTQITQLTTDNAQLAKDLADAKRFATMANNYQEDKKAGLPVHLMTPDSVPRTPSSNKPEVQTHAPRPKEAARSPQEAEKPITHPTPLPTPEKSLLERLEASMQAMLDWIKEVGGKNAGIDASVNNSHLGPIKHLDELHAVQHKGRGQYAVHRLADLDGVPALDDPATEISYRGGFGHVTGGRGGRGGLGD
jgi:hypothetical protein